MGRNTDNSRLRLSLAKTEIGWKWATGSWEFLNLEDMILISQKMAQDDAASYRKFHSKFPKYPGLTILRKEE